MVFSALPERNSESYCGHFGVRFGAFTIGAAALWVWVPTVVADIMRMRVILVAVFVFVCVFGRLAIAQSEQSSNDSGRKIVRKVEPQYPAIAKRMNLGGTVKVVAMVSSDGTVKKVEAVGGSPLLVQAAQNAVSLWKFAPGTESKETVELHFTP
jgi:periplasmic protein TonB